MFGNGKGSVKNRYGVETRGLLTCVHARGEMFNEVPVEDGYTYEPNAECEGRFAASRGGVEVSELGIWGLSLE